MKKFLDFLKRPPVWFVLVWLAVTLCAIACTLLCLYFTEGVINYVAYVFAALSLGYFIYIVIVTAPKIKSAIIAGLKKRNFTNKLMNQYGFRTVVFAIGSFSLSCAYVVFNGVLAIIYRSIWYGSLTAYYLLLAVMRGVVLHLYGGKNQPDRGSINYQVKALKIFRLCGIGLTVLPIALSMAILHMVLGTNSFEHYGYTIYVAALYAFYKIIMAIYNAVKAKKYDDAVVSTLRSINLADAFVSILALQTAMFKQFGGDAAMQGAMNMATGTAVCVLTAALGIYMIVIASIKLKGIKDGREV
ncbi:MAG: hypothetical protein ACI4MN_04570 [Candidatus Coproplasma sp.]